jgi:porin
VVSQFRFLSLSTILLATIFAGPGASADDDQGKAEKLPDSIVTALPIFADINTYRQQLYDQRGVQYQFTYIGDGQANLSGGVRRGGTYSGRLETMLEVDLGKFSQWEGGTVHFNAFAIHGRGLSRYNLDNILIASEIEALATVRLSEVWFEQSFGDKASIRIGQLAADTEFHTRLYGGLFVNGTFGWPEIAAVNLPSGGPAYPFAAPGVRVKITPTGKDDVTFLAAIFNGDPAGPGSDDPQRRNRFGVNFRLRDPPLIVGQAQFKYGSVKEGWLLPGSVKLGVWNHLGRFDDLRLSADGVSTADPSSSGTPVRRRGNDGIFAGIDQMIYSMPDVGEDKGISVFTRISGSPPDRNLISFYIDGGLNFRGVVPGRPDDAFGFAAAYARISPNASLLDQEKNFFNMSFGPVRNYEALFEATYQLQIMTGWSIQPDFQYIFHPGGNIPNPNDPNGIQSIHNAVVVGLRSTIRF